MQLKSSELSEEGEMSGMLFANLLIFFVTHELHQDSYIDFKFAVPMTTLWNK